jgi:hypothetical protein
MAAKSAILILVIFSFVTYVATLILGPVLFYSTSDGLKVAARSIHAIPLEVFMTFPVDVPIQVTMGALFGALVVIFSLCLVFAWRDRGGFIPALKAAATNPISFAKTNFLFMMPIAATALLYASVIIDQFQQSQGVQTGSLSFPPQTSPYVILINLAFAPVNEEIAFRITSIGIPVGLFLIFLYRHDPKVSSVKQKIRFLLLSMLSPEQAKAKLGYKNVETKGVFRGISPLEWVLISATSFAFGAAHYLLGGGWQIGKISTAFLAGFVFALMFVSYGAYAAILMHWFFDYYFTVLDLADSTYGGIFHSLANVVELTNIVVGAVIVVVILLYWAVKLADYLTLKASGIPRQEDS